MESMKESEIGKIEITLQNLKDEIGKGEIDKVYSLLKNLQESMKEISPFLASRIEEVLKAYDVKRSTLEYSRMGYLYSELRDFGSDIVMLCKEYIQRNKRSELYYRKIKEEWYQSFEKAADPELLKNPTYYYNLDLMIQSEFFGKRIKEVMEEKGILLYWERKSLEKDLPLKIEVLKHEKEKLPENAMNKIRELVNNLQNIPETSFSNEEAKKLNTILFSLSDVKGYAEMLLQKMKEDFEKSKLIEKPRKIETKPEKIFEEIPLKKKSDKEELKDTCYEGYKLLADLYGSIGHLRTYMEKVLKVTKRIGVESSLCELCNELLKKLETFPEGIRIGDEAFRKAHTEILQLIMELEEYFKEM